MSEDNVQNINESEIFGCSCCGPFEGDFIEEFKPNKNESKEICPACNKKGTSIYAGSIRFQLKKPWLHTLQSNYYFYCESESCDVAYFDETNSQIKKEELKKTEVPLVCYCFNISVKDIANEKSKEFYKNYVIEQTRERNCDCETNNPSGSCCLRNFPK